MGSPPQNNPTAGQNAGGAGGGGNKVKVTAPVAFGLSAAFKSEASFPHGEHVFVADVKKQFVDTDFVDPDRDLAVEKKGDKFEFKGAFASGPAGGTTGSERMRLPVTTPRVCISGSAPRSSPSAPSSAR